MKNLTVIIAAFTLVTASAQDIDSGVLAAIEAATGWTTEELSQGLAMLDRVYSNDCKTAEGRVRWHGPVVSTEFRTNELQKLTIYEDGFAHVEPFRPMKPKTVESRLDSASRKAEAAAKALKAKEDKLAYLLSHEAEEISRLSKDYPPDLAALLYTNSVNKARNAVAEFHPVTNTVTPE